MTIQVEESHESRALRDAGYANQRSIDVTFYAFDDADNPADLDPVDVRAEVFSVLSASPYGDPLYGLWFQELTLDPINRFTFIAKATWSVNEPAQTNLIKWGFTTAGTTAHVTHSIATIDSYGITGFDPPTPHDRAIGPISKDMQFSGCQRNVPELSFWVEAHFDPADWDATTLLTLNSMSWTYNLAEWHDWPAGYVMFTHCEAPEVTLGASTSGSPKLVPVKFYFKARGPEDVDTGSGITFTKAPWDHVWYHSVDQPHSGTNSMQSAVIAAYREQLYLPSDFTLLGLGS